MTDTATKAGPLPVRTILLLPDADTRERLLAPGAPVWICADPEVGEAAEFGITVDPATPVVDDYDDSDDSDPRDRIKVSWPSLGVCGSVVAALYLVLARDGAVVPEGVDRLCRVERSTPDCPFWEPFRLEGALTALLSGEHPPLVAARALFPLGTLVLLDVAGEVSSG